MAKNNQKTYWPHMILGFLAIGITLGYWTVKSAMSLPVQESNQYMLKYQMADITMNDILEAKEAFDSQYVIEIQNAETMVMSDSKYSRRVQVNPVKLLKGNNTFTYTVKDKDGRLVNDANVTFLLTQPHHRSEDKLITHIPSENNVYVVKNIDIQKEGRYTLQLRAKIKEAIGYSEIPAYLKL